MRLFVIGKTTTGKPHSIFVSFDVLVEDRIETFARSRLQAHVEYPTAFAFVDARGIRGVWKRTPEEARAFQLPKLVRVAERYQGATPPSLQREPVIEPKEDWEHEVLRLYKTDL